VLTIEEVTKFIRSNYEPVVKSLPIELQEEFCTRVLPIKEVEELAPFIITTTEFEGTASPGLTMRKIGRKLAVVNFNKKLVAAGIRPDDVYGGLLKGCFVFD